MPNSPSSSASLSMSMLPTMLTTVNSRGCVAITANPQVLPASTQMKTSTSSRASRLWTCTSGFHSGPRNWRRTDSTSALEYSSSLSNL
jgi:hypothetical protein